MQKKLTLSMDSTVYEGLHAMIGRGNISRFVEDLVRPYLSLHALESAYQEMAADSVREAEADEWSEALIADLHETR